MDPKQALKALRDLQRVKAVMKDGSRMTLTASWLWDGDDAACAWFGFTHRSREVLNGDILSIEMPEATTDTADEEHVKRFIDSMKAADVRAWLLERLQNCTRIARTKTGDDKRGWLEDAAFFSACIGLIDCTADDHPENRNPDLRTN